MVGVNRAGILVCVATLTTPGCATLAEGDRAYYVAQAGIAYDLLCQTSQIGSTPGVKEANPLVPGGGQPDFADAAMYWATAALTNHVVYTVMKDRWPGSARRLQMGIAGGQALVIANNSELGLECW